MSKNLVTLTETRFSLGDVFEHSCFGRREGNQPIRREYEGIKVKMDSARYEVFKRNHRCEWCGIAGQFFLLQQFRGTPEHYGHFNLYAEENGNLVLMTKDHKMAKAKGGSNGIWNMQTMCAYCNSLKAYRSDEAKKEDDNWLDLTWFEKDVLIPWVNVRRMLSQSRTNLEIRSAFVDFLCFYDKYPRGMKIRKWMYENHSLLFSLAQFHMKGEKDEEDQGQDQGLEVCH